MLAIGHAGIAIGLERPESPCDRWGLVVIGIVGISVGHSVPADRCLLRIPMTD